MSKKITRQDVKALAPEIREKYRELVKTGDLIGFKRLLGIYGAHIPSETKDELIEEFKRYAALWREQVRKHL